MSDKPSSKLQVAQTQIQSTVNSSSLGQDTPVYKAAAPPPTNPSNALELVLYLCGGLSCFMLTYCMMSLVHFWKDTYGTTGYI